jgi:hypothetical protein
LAAEAASVVVVVVAVGAATCGIVLLVFAVFNLLNTNVNGIPVGLVSWSGNGS